MTMPEAALTARIDRALVAEREAMLDDLGHDAVLWLALVPLWTKNAAEMVRFPAPSLIDFVQRARKAGWCETRGSLRDGGSANLRFWMPDHLRRDVLDLLRRYTSAAAAEIANRIMRAADPYQGAGNTYAPSRPTRIPGALEAWAGLAQAPSQADQRLVGAVGYAVDRGDLGQAMDLISAGEALAALLAGTMDVAVDRARRLLSLGRRRRMDAADLDRYLDRPELSGAVDRLLTADTGQWALHLRGAGGVGKTMLVKYLASGRYAADRGEDPFPVARMDFDYMSPDFPVRRPVQLLLELADELSLHTAGVGHADARLTRFRVTATSAHEAFSAARGGTSSPMRDEGVLRAINFFATTLNRLPWALLILDTCEELAKFDAGDPDRPAVTTTFEILERIHKRAPGVRVLFAGRRELPARDYLAVQPVSGFTATEALSYLSSFPGPPLAGDLAAEMIRQSPAVDGPGRISPFDLALYRSWAEEDPDLTAEQVARGSDAYIEGRIIERLGADEGDVLRSLPALATAGRCRVATLAEFLDVAAADLGQRLAAQEWIDAAGDPPVFVTAKPALAARLRRYFGAPERAASFGRETARLAGLLRERIAEATVGDVDIDEVLAALRLSGPAAAAALWDDLAERAKNAREWDWLRIAADRIRGEWEEEDWPTTRALRATVIAAHIAATRRSNPAFNTEASWAEVLDWWEDHPSPEAGRELRARAAVGLRQPRPEEIDVFPEVAAALTSEVHRLLDDDLVWAATGRLLPEALQPSAAVRAWTHVARARLNADANPVIAAGFLRDAEREAERAAEADVEYFDWIQPDDLLARVRIEFGLIAPPGDEKLAEWESYAESAFDTIDAERLASQCLRIRLSRGPIEKPRIEHWESIDRYVHAWQSACSAHEIVPPLFVALAEAWLAAGDPDRALALLDRRRRAALDTRQDDATIRAADLGTLRIARRLRLREGYATIARLAVDGVDAAHYALSLISGDVPDDLRAQLTRVPEAIPPRQVRSADPFGDVRVALRRAALTMTSYEPPPEVPRRLLAEMAFDEAELLGLVAPGAVGRPLAIARDAYTECGDHLGAVLAAVMPAEDTILSMVPVGFVEAALERLRAADPVTWNALMGNPGGSRRWGYWSGLVRRVLFVVSDHRSIELVSAADLVLRDISDAELSDLIVDIRGSGHGGTIEMAANGPLYEGRWETVRAGPVVATWPASVLGHLTVLRGSEDVARGVIRMEESLAAVPWERVLTESLELDAARVAWFRLLSLPIPRGSGTTIVTVFGQGISSSAGPRVAGATDQHAKAELIDPADLQTGDNALIVLRGDPVADEAEAVAGDDLTEKLEFALDLLRGGAAPAVLIVPALPAGPGRAVSEAIDDYIHEGLDDPLQLQMSVREYVPSALLNDIVLFVNEGAVRG